ncbi:MAG: DNA mismatch repair protein MutS [Oscillospiraceae bacterium]|nr:DNA mismatch repair protein MutS [Oscillospiraceae bacterium]
MPNDTPMMRQYRLLKSQTGNCILFFRLGDFYEMFDEDARLAARELDLTLTTRDRGAEREEDRTPMCGVPHHAAEGYIARLVAKGYKVALCEQTEDPAVAKGLVRREVVRIITPGTVVDASMLTESRNNYICSLWLDDDMAGVAFADVTTGEAYATQADGADRTRRALCELGRFAPREAILNVAAAAADREITSFLGESLGCLCEPGDEADFDIEAAERVVCERFSAKSPEALGLADKPAALRALGGLLTYLYRAQKGAHNVLGNLHVYDRNRFMELGLTDRRNLELTESRTAGGKKGSLLWVLDHTKTPMGGRLLRGWLEKPLLAPVDIQRRLDGVEELFRGSETRGELFIALSGLTDMERLIGRIVYGTGGGRDARALCEALLRLPRIKGLLGGMQAGILRSLFGSLDECADICDRLDATLTEEPPHSVKEGGVIRDGFDPEVDRLRAVLRDTRGLVAAMEASEKEKTGIKSLKVGYNRVFGYYIEVSKSYLAQVPASYTRKQTMTNGERYITEPLKEMETTILTASERLKALEFELFGKLREELSLHTGRIQQSARAAAGADALCSLAEAAARYRYAKPEVDYSDAVEIKEGRHPVVERMLGTGLFVPNDTMLDGTDVAAIVTGPNMAGKSTYMRQVALIVLMAQMGSFVPAQSARVGVVDRIFTRIGASDDLAGGRSTFMAEMTEVAAILQDATQKSLLILDEIGRGTSTFDGMSVARAVLEYVVRTTKAKTLFATHYHELTELEDLIDGVKNYNITVKRRGGEIIFLRKIVPGGADDSYGVDVAALAGLPDRVVRRAREILHDLEAGAPVRQHGQRGRKKAPPEPEAQVSMADMAAAELKDTLKSLNVETLTPIESMNMLYELSTRAKQS